MLCAFNLSDGEQPLNLPAGDWRQDKGAPFDTDAGNAVLRPWQAYFAVRETASETTI